MRLSVGRGSLAAFCLCILTLLLLWPAQYLGAAASSELAVPVEVDPHIGYIADYQQGPIVSAAAAIVLDNTTGTVLYAKNAHTSRAMASTTKIMTALVTLERGRLRDVVTVSPYAASTRGSSAHLYSGQKISVLDLLHGLLLRSGNDAAVALGEYISGNESAFVSLMNQRAAQLGLEKTRFQNPHGLDKGGHFSSAYDLAMMARIALLYPTFAEIVGTRSYAAPTGTTWHNTNRLLWSFDGAEGVKTGTTSLAGNCLVAAASRDGMQLITVVLGSQNRWADSRALLEYGFGQFHLLRLADQGSVLATLPIAGSDRTVVAVAEKPLAVVVHNQDVNALRTRLVVDRVAAPVHRLQTLGRYEVYLGDRLVAEVPIVADANIPRTPWWTRLRHRFFGYPSDRQTTPPSPPSPGVPPGTPVIPPQSRPTPLAPPATM